MWVKVDDGFPEHKKVYEAGLRLGANGSGRVMAIWLAGMCYCARALTDGHVPERILRTWTLYDRKPYDVAEAMALKMPDASPGLFVRTSDGFLFHDYADYQPLAKDVKAKRKKDRDRKRAEKEAREQAPPLPLAADSAWNPIWNPTWNPTRSRARDPDPVSQPQEQTKEHRAARGQPVENSRVLKALVWREMHAAYHDPTEEFRLPNVTERIKCVAARAELVYAVDFFHRQIEAAFERVLKQHGGTAA